MENTNQLISQTEEKTYNLKNEIAKMIAISFNIIDYCRIIFKKV